MHSLPNAPNGFPLACWELRRPSSRIRQSPKIQAVTRAHVGFPTPNRLLTRTQLRQELASLEKKMRKNRTGKKRRNRRQSFAGPPDDIDTGGMAEERPSLVCPTTATSAARDNFYHHQQGNKSKISLENEALLDQCFTKAIDTHFLGVLLL